MENECHSPLLIRPYLSFPGERQLRPAACRERPDGASRAGRSASPTLHNSRISRSTASFIIPRHGSRPSRQPGTFVPANVWQWQELQTPRDHCDHDDSFESKPSLCARLGVIEKDWWHDGCLPAQPPLLPAHTVDYVWLHWQTRTNGTATPLVGLIRPARGIEHIQTDEEIRHEGC